MKICCPAGRLEDVHLAEIRSLIAQLPEDLEKVAKEEVSLFKKFKKIQKNFERFQKFVELYCG